MMKKSDGRRRSKYRRTNEVAVPDEMKNDAYFIECVSMTKEQHDEELREEGLVPGVVFAGLQQKIKQTVAEARGRRTHHRVHTSVETLSPAPRVFSWASTHDFTDGLVALRREHAPLEEQGAWISWQFERLADAVSALGNRCYADLDLAWPAIEALQETVVELTDDHFRFFAEGAADFSARVPIPVKCMLIHGLSIVFERGGRSARLATHAFREVLRRDGADESRLLVSMLADQYPDLRAELHDELDRVYAPAVIRTRVDVEVARREAVDVLQRLRITGAEHQYFGHPTIVRLLDHHRADALPSILSMYALGDVFHCATRFLLGKPLQQQWEMRSAFTDKLRKQLTDDAPSHFLTMEMFERIRDYYPRFVASVMADLAPTLGARGRQSLFVCITEGYEKTYAGAKQPRVPQFVHIDDSPQFIPGKTHRLDLFAEEICSANIGGQMRAEMGWANRRLARWIDPTAEVNDMDETLEPRRKTRPGGETEVLADCIKR
jgi:hypothetical protein